MVRARGIDRLRARDFRAAILRAAPPSEVEGLVRSLVDVAREHEDVGQRLEATAMLVHWTAGRAYQAPPPVCPLELPEVRDVGSALDALALVTCALGRGDIDGHSARVYCELVGAAAKLATADAAVDALAAAGRVEYAWTDEAPIEAQLPAFGAWLAAQGLAGVRGAPGGERAAASARGAPGADGGGDDEGEGEGDDREE